MAILLVDYNVLFLHFPKTGGRWIENILLKLIPNSKRIGDRHESLDPFCYPKLYDGKTLHDIAKKCFVFSFVRHPVTWYVSYWAYMMSVMTSKKKWVKRTNIGTIWPHWTPNGWHPLDELSDCGSLDFRVYLDNVLSLHPHFLTRAIKPYIYLDNKPVNFIGRQENLTSDLINVLQMNNVACDYNEITKTPIFHSSRQKFKNIAKKYVKKSNMIDKIIMSEKEFINQFYNKDNSN